MFKNSYKTSKTRLNQSIEAIDSQPIKNEASLKNLMPWYNKSYFIIPS
jgi:hypothetical protein